MTDHTNAREMIPRPAFDFSDTLLTLHEVRKRLNIGRSTIYRRMAAGEFPEPVRLCGQIIRWQEHEINAWLARQPGYKPPSS